MRKTEAGRKRKRERQRERETETNKETKTEQRDREKERKREKGCVGERHNTKWVSRIHTYLQNLQTTHKGTSTMGKTTIYTSI